MTQFSLFCGITGRFLLSDEKWFSIEKYSIQQSLLPPFPETAHDAQSSSLQNWCLVHSVVRKPEVLGSNFAIDHNFPPFFDTR